MATTKKTAKNSTLKRGMGETLLKSLPDSVENLEIVQQVASVLGELSNRVTDVKEEASKELTKIMKRYESNCKGLEKKLSKVTNDAKKQAQTSMISIMQKWHEHKEKLPAPLAKEIEKIIAQIGTKVMERSAKKPSPKKKAVKKTAEKKTKASTKKTVSANAKTKRTSKRKASAMEPTTL